MTLPLFPEHVDPPKIKHPANGYAAPPGTGPKGESCKTCQHSIQTYRGYWKCGLMEHCWTHGYGTDIRLRSPACRRWEPEV